MDAVAGLDSRPDLLDMTPTEFEHLVRQPFEAIGMQSWVTQASKDDGVDAVAVNEDPFMGGHCIIQAKRCRSAVGVEPVRALAGVMDDKHATTGILVTTSWVSKDGHAFAQRHGRIRLIECEEIKYLCKEHLGLDVLISLPKPPPQRRWPLADAVPAPATGIHCFPRSTTISAYAVIIHFARHNNTLGGADHKFAVTKRP
jgi:restriction system protein